MPVEFDVAECDWLDLSQKKFFSNTVQKAKEASAIFNASGIRYVVEFLTLPLSRTFVIITHFFFLICASDFVFSK